MATTVTGAVRAILLAQPSLSTFVITRDEPAAKSPAQATFPYIPVEEEISSLRSPASGRGVIRKNELTQVDLWQARAAEDFTLRTTIERALDAAGLISIAPNGVIYRLLVESAHRLYDKQYRIVHDALTVRAVRGI